MTNPFIGKPAALTDNTNPDWIPNLNLGYTQCSQLSSEQTSARYERQASRKRKRIAMTPVCQS